MARSLSLAAYLAGLGSDDPTEKLGTQPPRPLGTVIWARCTDADQLTAIETLNRKLGEDGDQVQIIATVKDWLHSIAERALPEPQGRENIRSFIAHWKPVMMIWVQGDLDPVILQEINAADMMAILVDASADALELTSGNWVPGAIRSLLAQFDAIFTLDQEAAERLIRAGARASITRVTGAMEDGASPLPYADDERRELATALGTRPVWLAASADADEAYDLAAAHFTASRRAHRLLLIIVPRDPGEAGEIAEMVADAGMNVALRSEQFDPLDPTQVYVIDTEEELGLWYRIAPITYLGGTLYGEPCRDPFEPAALGSAVLYGPKVTPFERHAGRLNAAGASRLIRSSTDLGPLVENLLAPEKAAELAHAAWDVTSRGADVTNRIVDLIQRRLAEMDL